MMIHVSDIRPDPDHPGHPTARVARVQVQCAPGRSGAPSLVIDVNARVVAPRDLVWSRDADPSEAIWAWADGHTAPGTCVDQLLRALCTVAQAAVSTARLAFQPVLVSKKESNHG